MKVLEISKVTISIVGLSVEFNSDPLNIFYTLPGSIRAGKKSSRKHKYIFPAKYDIYALVDFLRKLPKKSHSYLLDADLVSAQLSRTYRFKMYKSGTGKLIPDFGNYSLRGLNSFMFSNFKQINPRVSESEVCPE